MDSKSSLSISITQPLDLATTLESGQAFRWRRVDGCYYGVLQGNLLALRQDDSQLCVRSAPMPPEQIESDLRDYLRLDDDL